MTHDETVKTDDPIQSKRPHRTAWELACGLAISGMITTTLTTLSTSCVVAAVKSSDHRLVAAFILLPILAGIGYFTFDKTSRSMARSRGKRMNNIPS